MSCAIVRVKKPDPNKPYKFEVEKLEHMFNSKGVCIYCLETRAQLVAAKLKQHGQR